MQQTIARVVTMIAVSASVLVAQAGTQPKRPEPPAGSGGQMARMAMPDSMRRREMQARMGDMLKQRFGFTDAQATRFVEANKTFAERARLIGEQDRDVRMAIREEMLRPDSARSSQLSALLDKQSAVRRQRAELADTREKELASFLTPLQRAKLSNARGAMRERDGMGGGHQGMRGGMRHRMQGMQGMQGPMGQQRMQPGAPVMHHGRRPGGDGNESSALPPVDPQP
jgi:hypothetical protein